MSYMSGGYKIAKVRMFRKELTKLRMYGSKRKHYRNVMDEKSSWGWQSKNAIYEMPYSVSDIVQLTGS